MQWCEVQAKSIEFNPALVTSVIWLGMGGNVSGAWGSPQDAFRRAIVALEDAGLSVVVGSSVYETVPIGRIRQPAFKNAVVGVGGSVAPGALLALLKRLERRAGRRANGRWAPRPLDIDILDFRGRIIGRPGPVRQPGRLVLPHPELHRRGFVLVPLLEVAPQWRHPRFGWRASALLERNPALTNGVRRVGSLSSAVDDTSASLFDDARTALF
jgi:2-amino-4-hydroxy-6-hydroxymethyldihydropteridine diphosphokinase